MAIDPEADRLISRAAELGATGAPDAREPLERAVKLAPDDPETLVRAAALSFDHGAYERAWELLVRARERAEDESEYIPTIAHIGGLILLHAEREAEALELLSAAFDASPAQRGFGYRLALALVARGRLDEARSVIARALQSGAQDDDLSLLRTHLSEAPGADQDVSLPEGMLAIAAVLATFDADRAVKLYDAALRAGDDAQRARAAFGLGTLLDEGDPVAAQQQYEAALSAEDPQISSAAAYNLGGLLVAGDPVQARAMFARAAQSPDPQLAELARDQLAALG